jgi:hypothetical protein
MREITIGQAEDEIKILDKVSIGLHEALGRSYDDLRANSPAVKPPSEDFEIAAKLHNIKRSLTEALEEVGKHGYGRVIFVREENEAGDFLRNGVYRVSQANASLPEAFIVARNGVLGSQVASCRVGDTLEIELPVGLRYFSVTGLIDLEGAMQLLRPRPEIKLARFYVAEDESVDVIRGVRAFLEKISASVDTEIVSAAPPATISAPSDTIEGPPDGFERYWPTDWSDVIFADEPESTLGTQFFTRTTRQQEDAIRAVRGVTLVHGIAGTGKTSVALGRLKFFSNFRSGEHLEEYGLNPGDWADFDSSDMVGFVLSPSLVQYLKQTADDLEMRIKIMDFEEYRNQERQSRRLFGRPFKRSPDANAEIQQSVQWLRALDEAASGHVADEISSIQKDALAKPDTPDGGRITDQRWRDLESQFWKAGPLRARLVGLVRGLRGAGTSFHLQGLANTLDRDVRLSDGETASLTAVERRAVREAVLNISLRLFRLLNPSELYVAAYRDERLRPVLLRHFQNDLQFAEEAARRTATRLGERMITDDDTVTALCLNALTCDQFEREIRDIPYLATFSNRVGVFIDEYQDFSEQQVFLMGFRAKRKYRQITVAGDAGQRLHAGGVTNIAAAFPYVSESVRQISLETNFRQSKWLAQLSSCFRSFTQGGTSARAGEPCDAPLYAYDDRKEFAEFLAAKISALPDAASVVVIAPTAEAVQDWFDMMAPSLESAFRNPIISDRARLTERLKTHFTTPLEAKGLEFDIAVVPDISDFDETNAIALNGLYVAVSRPRHGLLLGSDTSEVHRSVIRQLCDNGDLRIIGFQVDEKAA